MLRDMGKSFNVQPRGLQKYIYFNCVEVRVCTANNPSVLYIQDIHSLDPWRGYSTRAMNEIAMYADRHQITLYCSIKPYPDYENGPIKMNEWALINWLERRGFEVVEYVDDKKQARSSQLFTDMRRTPKKSFINYNGC